MTVRDLIVKLTETGELSREVMIGRVVKEDRDQAKPRILIVEPLYPVEKIWLGTDDHGWDYLALLD